MTKPATYPVMERFPTLQGEGAWTGHAAWFIRLGGCDVGCAWCDVKESWPVEAHPQVTVETLVIAVTGSVRRTATQWAVTEAEAGRHRAGMWHTHGHLDIMPCRAVLPQATHSAFYSNSISPIPASSPRSSGGSLCESTRDTSTNREKS